MYRQKLKISEMKCGEVYEKEGKDMPFRKLPGAVKCGFRKGERIVENGRRATYVYYLVRGIAYVEETTQMGHESIMEVRYSGQGIRSLLGILAQYNQVTGGVTYYDIVARTDCTCYQISVRECKKYLKEHSEMLEDLVSMAMETYMHMWGNFYSTKDEGGASRKLCSFMIEHSLPTQQGYVLSDTYTNVELSKFVAVHKVTIARMLRVLKEEGTIERIPAGILLKNMERMEEYAGNDRKLKYK